MLKINQPQAGGPADLTDELANQTEAPFVPNLPHLDVILREGLGRATLDVREHEMPPTLDNGQRREKRVSVGSERAQIARRRMAMPLRRIDCDLATSPLTPRPPSW